MYVFSLCFDSAQVRYKGTSFLSELAWYWCKRLVHVHYWEGETSKSKGEAHQKPPRFFQDLIELFTATNGRVVDLTCSTGSPIMATRACDKILLHLRVTMTCLSIYWNHFWKIIWKRGHLRRIFKIIQEKMMIYRMRRCLNLSVSKFWYHNYSFHSLISLNSLVHFYFFKINYIFDRFYFKNTTEKRTCLPFWTIPTKSKP